MFGRVPAVRRESQVVECIGACCWAPAIQINYDFHENLTPDKVDVLFKMYRDGKGKDEK